jgi:hypothetical protein
MTASIIPPPILQSTATLRPAIPTHSVTIERPDATRTRQQELEADLQFLLDAQADGLVRGLEGGSVDDYSSAGSRTPTAHSVRAAKGKRPAGRKLGLRSARRGIHRNILALSALKEEELQELEVEEEKTTETLNQIDAWESKRGGLEEATQNVRTEEDNVRVQRLRHEAEVLGADIQQAEEQLMEMKLRHRKLMSQATAVENSVQAKLASYTSSLRLLEEDVQKFLRRGAPSDPRASRSQSRNYDETSQTPYLQTPVKQRSLQRAKDHYQTHHATTSRQRQSLSHEKHALDTGAALWQQATHEIHTFETLLRNEMALLSSSTSSPQQQHPWDDDDPNHEPSSSPSSQQQYPNNTTRLKALLTNMSSLLTNLQTNLSTAESQNWNLLIAAFGAEISALEKGREILEGVLRASGEEIPEHRRHHHQHHQKNLDHNLDHNDEENRGRRGEGDVLVDATVASPSEGMIPQRWDIPQGRETAGGDDKEDAAAMESLDREFDRRRTRVATPTSSNGGSGGGGGDRVSEAEGDEDPDEELLFSR